METKFLLLKLKEASDSLLSYEFEAAPKGWRFLWDRYSVYECTVLYVNPTLCLCVCVCVCACMCACNV